MTTVTVQKDTTEPGKRVLRTIVATVIGAATALPVILGAIVLPKGTELAAVATDIVGVSTGISALMANPTINKGLAKIGLGAATVTKIKTATLAASDPITPAIEAAIKAVKAASTEVQSGDTAQAVETVGAGVATAVQDVQAEIPLVQDAVQAAQPDPTVAPDGTPIVPA